MIAAIKSLRNRIGVNEKVLERKLWKFEVAEYVILLMILVYAVVFSYYTIMLHYSFRTYAWDLGTLVQSIASVTKGELFVNNVESYFSPTGSYFGVHFAPILFTIVPFFSLAPTVETLFVIQTLVLSMSVIPLYLLAKYLLNDRLVALLFSAAYLFNPLLQSANWYYITPQTFLPLLVLSATYFLKRRKNLLFVFCVVLTLMTLEQMSYFVLLYALYVAWEVREDIKKMLHVKRPSMISLMPFIVFIMATAWIFLAGNVIHALNPNPSAELKAIGNFAMLDIKDLKEIPVKIITSPDLALRAINYDYSKKMLYLALNFASCGSLAVLSPIALLPALPWFGLSLLSNHAPYYEFGFHYTAMTLPFIMIAAIETLRKLPGKFDARFAKTIFRNLSIMLLVLGILLAVFASPLSPLQKPQDYSFFRDYGITSPSLLDETMMETLRKVIPSEASVLTTPTIFPHVATNINAYVIPPENLPSPRLYTEQLKHLESLKYDYIVYTYFWDKSEADVIYHDFIENQSSYGLFAKGAGLELYKAGFDGDPTKIPIKFSYKELPTWDSMIVDDSSSESGRVIKLKPSNNSGKVVWYGPYITLAPGNYNATFRLKIDRIIGGRILRLEISSESRSVPEIEPCDLKGTDFIKPLTWQTFSVPFNVTQRIPNVEFRGLEAAANLTIWLDYVEITTK